MAIGLITGALLLGGSFLAGKSRSGGGIEIGTNKKSEQITNTSQDSYSSVFSPTSNRTIDFSRNYAFGQSAISTKKENSTSQEPSTSAVQTPTQSVSPIANLGGGGSSGEAKTDFMGLAMIGAVGFGAYLFLTKDKGSKK